MSREVRQQPSEPRSIDLIEIAERFYATVLTDFDAAVRDHLADGFVLENYLPSDFPFGGRYEGAAGLGRYLSELATAIDMGSLEMSEWVSSGDVVVVRGSEASTVRATGKGYAMDFVHWLRFDEEGRLLHMREFNDTAAMAVAFRGETS